MYFIMLCLLQLFLIRNCKNCGVSYKYFQFFRSKILAKCLYILRFFKSMYFYFNFYPNKKIKRTKKLGWQRCLNVSTCKFLKWSKSFSFLNVVYSSHKVDKYGKQLAKYTPLSGLEPGSAAWRTWMVYQCTISPTKL